MFFIWTLQNELTHKMEGFLNSLNSSHIFIRLKAPRKYLKRGGNTWKVTDSMMSITFKQTIRWILCNLSCASLPRGYAPWWLMLAKVSQL